MALEVNDIITNTFSASTFSASTIFIDGVNANIVFAPSINGGYLPISGGTVTGTTNFLSASATTLSGKTIFSGSTNLDLLFGKQSDITSVQNQLLTKSSLSGATFTGTINGTSISGTSISANTIFSGSTNLSSLISSNLVQTQFTGITTDVSTTSTSFVDLLTTSINTGENYLIINLTFSVTNTSDNKALTFRVLLDGSSIGGSQITNSKSNIAESGSFVKKTLVSAGTHIIKVQWHTNSNAAQIHALTIPDEEHCNILISEVKK